MVAYTCSCGLILLILAINVLQHHAAIPITIGLKSTLFNVSEDDGSVQVCYQVLSGRTATRSISMQLRTVQGDAIGKTT